MFDWDDDNTAHIAAHEVEPQEAEDALADPRCIGTPAYNNSAGERRWAAIGRTASGRLLFIVYTKRDGLIRIVTARDGTDANRRRYKQRGK